jgi:hypothetical protein
MSNNKTVNSAYGNKTGSIDKIRVENCQTRDQYVSSVYRGSRNWKRLARRKGPKTTMWVERRLTGPNTPATEEDEIWLNDVWEDHKDYPNVLRFPRESDQLSVPFVDLPTWKNLPRFDPCQVPKTSWLIESFLAERSIQLVFGERGSFKSTLFLFAAKADANGEKFLGMKTRRRTVLYLDYENPANIIKGHNDDLGLDLPRNENLVVWDRFGTQPPPRPGDHALEAFVMDCIAETGHPPWIIFDSWASLLKPGEGGEFTGQTAPIYLQLRKLADLGATVTMIDHSGKYEKNTLYGGQDKEAKADSIHKLLTFPNKLRPNNRIIRVESWLKRAAPEAVVSFAFEVQSEQDRKGNWHIVGLVPAQDPIETRTRENVEILRNLIKQNPNSGQEALAGLAAKQGIPRDQAIATLKDGVGKYWQVRRTRHNKC